MNTSQERRESGRQGAPGARGPMVFEMKEIASREERDDKTPSQRAHERLDALFPRPEHAANALHGVVPPAFREDDRWPDAGDMPDLLGQCGAFLGIAHGDQGKGKEEAQVPKGTDLDASTSPAVVEGTLEELHQVMPYLF